MKPLISLFCLISFLFSSQSAAETKTKRQKVIDFEDELVEGINKRPLDSLSQISERKKQNQKPHLYKKRAGFHSEMDETLRVLRFIQ